MGFGRRLGRDGCTPDEVSNFLSNWGTLCSRATVRRREGESLGGQERGCDSTYCLMQKRRKGVRDRMPKEIVHSI